MKDVSEQETLLLQLAGVQSAVAFQSFLKQYHLEPLQVAIASGVRYLTVWNIEHGNPVSRAHAALVSHGLRRLTGVPYRSPIFITS
jgi:uncharacterized membrane protein YjjB (DUF3815 family)